MCAGGCRRFQRSRAVRPPSADDGPGLPLHALLRASAGTSETMHASNLEMIGFQGF